MIPNHIVICNLDSKKLSDTSSFRSKIINEIGQILGKKGKSENVRRPVKHLCKKNVALKNNLDNIVRLSVRSSTGVDYKQRWMTFRTNFSKVFKHKKTNTSQNSISANKCSCENVQPLVKPPQQHKHRFRSTVVPCSDELLDPRKNSCDVQTYIAENRKKVSFSRTSQKNSDTESFTTTSSTRYIRIRTNESRNTSQGDSNSLKPIEESIPKTGLEIFFDGILDTVKTFSPTDQYLAKARIFHVVTEIEAKYYAVPMFAKSTSVTSFLKACTTQSQESMGSCHKNSSSSAFFSQSSHSSLVSRSYSSCASYSDRPSTEDDDESSY